MTEIKINECISWINDRGMAIEFERLAHPYFKAIEDLTASNSHSRILKRIYLSVVFDPEVMHGADGLEFCRYSRTKREAEATIDVRRDEFARLSDDARLRLVAARVVRALYLIKQKVHESAIELAALIRTVETFNASHIPGHIPVSALPFQNEAGQIVSRSVDGDNSSEVPGSNFQLVIQFGEELILHSDIAKQLEQELSAVLAHHAVVDGHDVGQGKLNIFIICSQPELVLEPILALLERHQLLSQAKVASTRFNEDDYKLHWPTRCEVRFELF